MLYLALLFLFLSLCFVFLCVGTCLSYLVFAWLFCFFLFHFVSPRFGLIRLFFFALICFALPCFALLCIVLLCFTLFLLCFACFVPFRLDVRTVIAPPFLYVFCSENCRKIVEKGERPSEGEEALVEHPRFGAADHRPHPHRLPVRKSAKSLYRV